MNPLLNAQECALYSMDSEFITLSRFSQPTPETLVLVFSDQPKFDMPKEFFLMPEDHQNGFTSYLCTTTSEIIEHYVESTERTYYLVEADMPENHDELKVQLVLSIDITPEGSVYSTPVTIRDISVGGILISSSRQFEKGTPFSFIFNCKKRSVLIDAKIVSHRPTSVPDTFAYGCQFINLSPSAERTIRDFVFTEDLLQKRGKHS